MITEMLEDGTTVFAFSPWVPVGFFLAMALLVGFWFAPTRHEIAFAEVARMERVLEQEEDPRGGTSTHEYLIWYPESGEGGKVPVGDLMRAGLLQRVLNVADARGIPVSDRTMATEGTP